MRLDVMVEHDKIEEVAVSLMELKLKVVPRLIAYV